MAYALESGAALPGGVLLCSTISAGRTSGTGLTAPVVGARSGELAAHAERGAQGVRRGDRGGPSASWTAEQVKRLTSRGSIESVRVRAVHVRQRLDGVRELTARLSGLGRRSSTRAWAPARQSNTSFTAIRPSAPIACPNQVERLTSSKSQSRKARTLGRCDVCAGYAT